MHFAHTTPVTQAMTLDFRDVPNIPSCDTPEVHAFLVTVKAVFKVDLIVVLCRWFHARTCPLFEDLVGGILDRMARRPAYLGCSMPSQC